MENKRAFAFTGYVSLIGAVTMLIGAACWGASGTDIWQALAGDQMETYLSQLPDVKRLLAVNTFFWSLGALLMVSAITLMAKLCISNTELAQMAKVFSMTGASLAIVSFIIMLSPAITTPSIEIATVIGWIGARLDDIATTLIIGFSPLCLSIAGKADWIPAWLAFWGILAGIAGLLGITALFTGAVSLGFIIIPVGIGWMIASGIVLIKKSRSAVG